MKIVYFATLLASLCAIQDPWKGDEYAKNSESQKDSADDFMKGIALQGSEAILDVGCGDGKITEALARAVPDGSVLGVDISPSMISFAKNAFPHTNNLAFEVQDAARISFQNSFDLITSFTVMQWVLEQETALKRFQEALKPKGRLWIQMPTGLPAAMVKALQITICKPEWSPFFKSFSPPWRFYAAEEYSDLLSKTGFDVMRLELSKKHERFPSRSVFHGFLKQWFPYLRPLSAEAKDTFLTQLLDQYFQLLPLDEKGRPSFIVERLEVEAQKVN